MCEKWWIKLYEQLWNGWNIEQRQQTPNSSPKLTCNTIFLAKRPKIQLPENNQIMVVLMKFHNLVFTTKFIRTSAIWTSIPESEKSLPFRIARRRYLRSGPCWYLKLGCWCPEFKTMSKTQNWLFLPIYPHRCHKQLRNTICASLPLRMSYDYVLLGKVTPRDTLIIGLHSHRMTSVSFTHRSSSLFRPSYCSLISWPLASDLELWRTWRMR